MKARAAQTKSQKAKAVAKVKAKNADHIDKESTVVSGSEIGKRKKVHT